MIIYKNVDYGIYAYQIGFFKVKRIGEIVWSDHYDSKNEKFYLRIEGFYVAEERRRHGLGRKLLNKTIKQNLNENYPYMIVYPKTFGEKILKDKTNYQEFLETMAYLDLIVNRNCTPPTIVDRYIPVAGSIDDKTDTENRAQYIKIKSSILGIRYTYNENGKLLISGPRKAPGKYSKIKKEKFSWKICSDVLQ